MQTWRQIWMVGVLVALLAISSLSGGCSSDRSQVINTVGRDLEQLPGGLWEDSENLVNDKMNVALLLLGGGASGYTRCAHDDEIEDHFAGHHTFPRDFTIGAGTVGNPLSHFGLAASGYLYGVLAQDDQMHDIGGSLIEALSLNGILTMGLKVAAQDRGPNGEFYAWPSGHTSSSVTFATVMNEYYGPWVGLPLYGLSGLVMYERMETGEHWASDVVFGAVLGYTVGKTVAGKYKPEIFGMRLLPYLNPESGATGVVLAKEF